MLVVEGIVFDRTVFYEDSHSSFHGQRGSLLPQRHSDGVCFVLDLEFSHCYQTVILFTFHLANSLILQNKMQILAFHHVQGGVLWTSQHCSLSFLNGSMGRYSVTCSDGLKVWPECISSLGTNA